MPSPPLHQSRASLARQRRKGSLSSPAPSTASLTHTRNAPLAPKLSNAHRSHSSSSSILPTIHEDVVSTSFDYAPAPLKTNKAQSRLTVPLASLPAPARKQSFFRKLFGGNPSSSSSSGGVSVNIKKTTLVSSPGDHGPILGSGSSSSSRRPSVERKVSFSTLTVSPKEHSLNLPPAQPLPTASAPINIDLQINLHRPSMDSAMWEEEDVEDDSSPEFPARANFATAKATIHTAGASSDEERGSLLFAPTPCSTPSSRSASSDSAASRDSFAETLSDRLRATDKDGLVLRRFPSKGNKNRGRRLTRDENNSSISRDTGKWLIGGLFAPRSRSTSQQSAEQMLTKGSADSRREKVLATTLREVAQGSGATLAVVEGMGRGEGLSRSGSFGGCPLLEVQGLELVGGAGVDGGLSGWFEDVCDEIYASEGVSVTRLVIDD